VAPAVSNAPSQERPVLLQGKSTADQQKEKTLASIIGLISALNESTVADEVNVVFGHQQEEREPVIDSEDELLTGTSPKAS
jgi:hypothetical protein